MKDTELKKLKRADLLAMLIEQSKTVEALKAELEEKTKLLEKREIDIKHCGSVAEAALKLNQIFEDAQRAAEQYVYNVKIAADAGTADL